MILRFSDKSLLFARARSSQARNARSGAFILLHVAFFLPMPVVAQSWDSTYCRGKLISVGERASNVAAKCGTPDSSEPHDEFIGDPDIGPVEHVIVEEWSYNFGPHEFIRLITLRNGVVTSIRLGRYGYDKTAEPKRECDEQVVRFGESRSDVLARCGEPTWRDEHDETFSNGDRTLVVRVEVWTYDLGPHRFIRVLTFRNGKLASVSSGEYGYRDRSESK